MQATPAQPHRDKPLDKAVGDNPARSGPNSWNPFIRDVISCWGIKSRMRLCSVKDCKALSPGRFSSPERSLLDRLHRPDANSTVHCMEDGDRKQRQCGKHWENTMNRPRRTADDFLTISPRVRVLPIIHGAGDFALRVREELLAREYDCLAVPLPPSFQEDVEEAIERLPRISVVVQPDVDRHEDETGFSYVPIDPCQGVIAGLRTAIGERLARQFIDMETPRFEAVTGIFPDPYALKRVAAEQFSAALRARMLRQQ